MLKTICKNILSGISAGICIAIGGTVFLACDNKYVGAAAFSVALLCICYKGYALFTGKIGFIPEKHGKPEVSVLLWGLFGNLIGTLVGGAAVRYALPLIGAGAEGLAAAKLAAQTAGQTFLRACFCGVLMYLAVSIFRDSKTPVGILFCIPVFILSGFEHSVADMFYFFAAASYTVKTAVFLLLVLAGNAVGAVALPALSGGFKRGKS